MSAEPNPLALAGVVLDALGIAPEFQDKLAPELSAYVAAFLALGGLQEEVEQPDRPFLLFATYAADWRRAAGGYPKTEQLSRILFRAYRAASRVRGGRMRRAL